MLWSYLGAGEILTLLFLSALLSTCLLSSFPAVPKEHRVIAAARLPEVAFDEDRDTSRDWPSFLAEKYEGSHQPKLTIAQKAKIRDVLKRIRPCQQRFLRFAFPNTSSKFLPHFVLYFGPTSWGHPYVIDGRNLIYDEIHGTVFPTDGAGLPNDFFTFSANARRTGCPAGSQVQPS